MRDREQAKERDYIEKRDFIRMKVNTQATVSVDQEDSVSQGICHDLSGSGMLLTLDKQLPLHSELCVTLKSEDGNGPSLTARCIIARLQQTANNKCLLGLEILEVINDAKGSEEVA